MIGGPILENFKGFHAEVVPWHRPTLLVGGNTSARATCGTRFGFCMAGDASSRWRSP